MKRALIVAAAMLATPATLSFAGSALEGVQVDVVLTPAPGLDRLGTGATPEVGTNAARGCLVLRETDLGAASRLFEGGLDERGFSFDGKPRGDAFRCWE